jgi:hypothetical protein
MTLVFLFFSSIAFDSQLYKKKLTL